jgi:hypothetical protein
MEDNNKKETAPVEQLKITISDNGRYVKTMCKN